MTLRKSSLAPFSINDHGKGETMLQYYNNDMAIDSSTEIEMKTDL